MTSWRLPLALGLGLSLAALAISPAGIAGWLDPEATAARSEQLARGVRLWQWLLILDAGLLLGWAGLRAWRPRVAANPPPPAWSAGGGAEGAPAGYGWALAGILAAAALARLPGLDGDLWLDEVLSLVDFFRLGPAQILSDYRSDNQHMLYSLMASVSSSLLGERPATLRLPALLCGVASVWATARLARLALGPREALGAAALLAFSYHHVWFSQNARGYTLLLLATLLSTELLLRGLARSRARTWILYSLVLAAGAAAHLTMAFVGVAHGCLAMGALLRKRSARSAAFHAIAALALAAWFVLHAYALVLPQMLDFFQQPGAGSSTRPVAWSSPIWMINETLRHLNVGLALGWTGMAAGIAFFGLGGLRCLRRDPLFAFAMVLPALIGTLTMFELGRSLWPRFFFNQLGFGAMIAVSGALALGDGLRAWRPRLHPGWAWVPLVVLCLASAASLPRVYRLPKQDYTGARDFVRARLGPEDGVVGLHMAGRVYHRYYAPEWPEITELEEFQAARVDRSGSGRTWVLYTLPGYLETARPELMAVLEAEFEEMESFPGTLGDGSIIVRRSLAAEEIRR